MLKKNGNVSIRPHSIHAANSVVMIPPKEFQFNVETAHDNAFQQRLNGKDSHLRLQAMMEYRQMVAILRREGVQVIEFDYAPSDVATPDAVFPNNWFSTTPDGGFYTFPMASANRQSEVRSQELVRVLQASGREVRYQESLVHYIEQQAYLESTGAMVIDHMTCTIYAALSQRCDARVLEEYAQRIGYPNVMAFHSQLPSGQPIYHTNVMMSVGEHFCVICPEVIPASERRFVLKSLAKNKQIIAITLEQMNHFCANILQLETRYRHKVIAMSQSAYHAFSPAQRAQLASHGKLLPFNVNTIETIGGGSVRCMLGEVFLGEK